MEMSRIVATIRLHYHANVVDIVNSLNQIGIIPDEKAETINKKHTMLIVNDIAPRLKK